MRIRRDSTHGPGDIEHQSYDFACAVVHLIRELGNDLPQHLAQRILEFGTSIGADVADAEATTSKRAQLKGFEEARRASRKVGYWLKLLIDAEIADAESIRPYLEEAHDLHTTLTSICVRARQVIDS
jgi:four helix bundle protein